ncbi:MAG TPA: PEP-CTERM sorting domain-containing protein, partial [Steroidobacteraceae bacterium]|nr:PEP-CTERM sorting domain-containing protein [Steroidobacteraceae bacterium]
ILFGELTSYSFTLGGYHFSGTRGQGSYDLDGSGNIVGGSMIFANLFALDFLDVGGAQWTILDCNLFKCGSGAAGTGSYTRTRAVPEPGTLSLLGLSLIGLGMMRRRRPLS